MKPIQSIAVVLLLIILSLFGCSKDFEPIGISHLVEDLEGDIKTLTQIRLSFGQAVANATHDDEFREYILKTSKNNKNYYNEIVFALHKDDIVSNNKTLEQFIAENISSEVEKLYGSSFITPVITVDPLITIKIPDIFLNVEWDTDVIPMVNVRTPFAFGDEDRSGLFPVFHAYGYQELIYSFEIKYLSLVVKQSEDYILLDFDTKTTNQGLMISSILPQLDEYWLELEPILKSKSKAHSIVPNYRYLKLRDVKDLIDPIQNTIRINYSPLQDEICSEECLRDCRNPEDVLTFIDTLKMNQFYLYNEEGMRSIIEDDNTFIQFQISTPITNTREIQFISFFGMRYSEIFQPDIEMDCDIDVVEFDGLGYIPLPRITYVETTSDYFVDIPVNLLISEEIIDDDSNILVSAYELEFGIVLYERSVVGGSVYTSVLTRYGHDSFSYCTSPDFRVTGTPYLLSHIGY